MKKRLYFLGVLLLTCLLAACEDLDKPSEEPASVDNTKDTTTVAEETYPNANEADYAQTQEKRASNPAPIFIKDVPSHALPPDIVSLGVAEMPNRSNLQLLGQRQDSSWQHLAIFPESFYYNANKILSVTFEQEHIKVCSQKPFKATLVCGLFEWNPTLQRLRLAQDYSEDLSDTLLLEARKLASEWKFREAVATYERILYPQAYFDAQEEAIMLLEAAHDKAFQLYQQGEHEQAANMITQVLDFWGSAFFLEVENRKMAEEKFKSYPNFSVSKWLQIMSDYGLFLLKSQKYEQAVVINTLVVGVAPDIPNTYLQLGDAYFDIGQTEKGREAYRKYKQEMQKRNRKVPQRVMIRINE